MDKTPELLKLISGSSTQSAHSTVRSTSKGVVLYINKAEYRKILRYVKLGKAEANGEPRPGAHCGADSSYRECEAPDFCKKYKRCGYRGE